MENVAAEAGGMRLTGRRAVSVAAAISLLAVLVQPPPSASTGSTPNTAITALGFLLALGAVIAVLTSGPERRLDRLDVGLLLLAMALFLAKQRRALAAGYRGHTDEARLGAGALKALLAGADPYAVTIPGDHGTRMLDGALLTHYPYPPFTLELGAAVSVVSQRLAQPWVLSTLALFAAAAFVFFALPRNWRALSIPVVLGFGLLTGYATAGFPSIIALPLVCFAVYRWTDIGAGGRLRASGVARAAALGLAAATQQLTWLVAAFLLVAVWVVRSGEVGRRRATLVLLRCSGIAGLTFLVVNAPVLLMGPKTWAHGITAVYLQQAMPFGPGLLPPARDAVGHVDLQYLSYATALLLMAFLLVTAVGLKRVAAAVPVFLGLPFLLNPRADVEYLVVFAALWLVWAGTADFAAVSRSQPVRLPGRFRPVLTTWPRRIAACAAAALPAVAMCAVALSAAPAVQTSMPFAVPLHSRVRSLVVAVSNTTAGSVRPLFYLAGGRRSHRLRPAGNVALVLPPHSHRMVRLVARSREPARPTWVLETVTASPPSITWVPVPVHGRTHHRPTGTRDVQPASDHPSASCPGPGRLLASGAAVSRRCVG